MAQTSGTDLLLAAFSSLSVEEQEQVHERITEEIARRRAGDLDQAERFLVSMRRAAEHLGEPPNSHSYRRVWAELRGSDAPIESLQAVIKHFGSWRQAREALDLSATSTSRMIEARFARRRLGKVWRYTEQTLRQALADCVAELGHVPQVAEFDHWRRRQLELAAAQGDDARHLPSPSAYRRRYGSWEKALLHFGYTPDEVAERLERG